MQKSDNDTIQFPERNPITFTVVFQGQEIPVHTYENQFFSLMSLIDNRLNISGFGLCSGMGSCGTCLLSIYNEQNKLERTTLSCQLRINDELANLKIVIPERTY